MGILDDIPLLLEAPDPEEVKMWSDKLHLLLREIIRLLQLPPEQVPGVAVWSVGPFFGSGAIEVGQAVPLFIVPAAADGFELTDLKVSFQAGTLTGDTEIEVHLLSGATDTVVGTSTLTSLDVAFDIYSVALTPVSIATGDRVRWDCVTAGGHEAVTAVVTGRQAT